MVCCPALEGTTTIKFDNLGERPYANLTMDWMKAAGCTEESPSQS